MEWIKCSDRMPNHCDYILGFYKESSCYRCKRNGAFFTSSCDSKHWRIDHLKYDDWGWWKVIGSDGETSEEEMASPDYWISEEYIVPELLKLDINACRKQDGMD